MSEPGQFAGSPELIAKYGADGLRYGLMRIAPRGQDIRFDERQIVEGRNFCNKLWNAMPVPERSREKSIRRRIPSPPHCPSLQGTSWPCLVPLCDVEAG